MGKYVGEIIPRRVIVLRLKNLLHIWKIASLEPRVYQYSSGFKIKISLKECGKTLDAKLKNLYFIWREKSEIMFKFIRLA